jgi:hypothetical protein
MLDVLERILNIGNKVDKIYQDKNGLYFRIESDEYFLTKRRINNVK